MPDTGKFSQADAIKMLASVVAGGGAGYGIEWMLRGRGTAGGALLGAMASTGVLLGVDSDMRNRLKDSLILKKKQAQPAIPGAQAAIKPSEQETAEPADPAAEALQRRYENIVRAGASSQISPEGRAVLAAEYKAKTGRELQPDDFIKLPDYADAAGNINLDSYIAGVPVGGPVRQALAATGGAIKGAMGGHGPEEHYKPGGAASVLADSAEAGMPGYYIGEKAGEYAAEKAGAGPVNKAMTGLAGSIVGGKALDRAVQAFDKLKLGVSTASAQTALKVGGGLRYGTKTVESLTPEARKAASDFDEAYTEAMKVAGPEEADRLFLNRFAGEAGSAAMEVLALHGNPMAMWMARPKMAQNIIRAHKASAPGATDTEEEYAKQQAGWNQQASMAHEVATNSGSYNALYNYLKNLSDPALMEHQNVGGYTSWTDETVPGIADEALRKDIEDVDRKGSDWRSSTVYRGGKLVKGLQQVNPFNPLTFEPGEGLKNMRKAWTKLPEKSTGRHGGYGEQVPTAGEKQLQWDSKVIRSKANAMYPGSDAASTSRRMNYIRSQMSGHTIGGDRMYRSE